VGIAGGQSEYGTLTTVHYPDDDRLLAAILEVIVETGPEGGAVPWLSEYPVKIVDALDRDRLVHGTAERTSDERGHDGLRREDWLLAAWGFFYEDAWGRPFGHRVLQRVV